MVNLERLQANAEDAQIRCEMAYSKLQAARTNVRELDASWSAAKKRKSIGRPASSPAPSSRVARD